MFVVNVTKSIIFHVYSRVKMLPKPRQSQALILDLFPEIPVLCLVGIAHLSNFSAKIIRQDQPRSSVTIKFIPM